MDEKSETSVVNPYAKAIDKDKKDDEADELINSLPKWQKIVFMVVFNFFSIQVFVFVYFGFLIVTIIALPVIALTMLSVVTQTVNMIQNPQTGWYHFLSEILILITYYPIFTLLVTILVQMLGSFIKPFQEDAVAVLFNYKTLTKRFFNKNAKRWWMMAQFAFFLVYFLVTDILLALSFVIQDTNFIKFSKQYLLIFLCINALITVIGFIRVVIHSWKKYIYPKKKIKNPDSKMIFKFLEDDQPFMILIPIDYFDPGQLRKQEEWINLISDPNCNALLTTYKRNIVGKIAAIIAGALNILQIICGIAVSYETIHTSGSNQLVCIILPILSIISFPLISIVNISLPFYNRKKFDDKISLGQYLLIVALILIIGIPLIILVFFALVIALKIEIEPVPVYYEYQEYGNYSYFTYPDKSNIPNVCLNPLFMFHNMPMYIEDVVVLQTLSEYIDTSSAQSFATWNCTYGENRASFAAILQYVFRQTFPYVQNQHTCFDKQLHTSILEITDKSNTLDFILAQGMSSQISVAAFFEIFMQQYFPTIIGTLVPFASLVISLFQDSFNSIQVYSQNGMHITPIVNQVATKTYDILNNIMNINPSNVIGVGQGTGAYLIKLLSYALKSSGVVLDSLNLFATYTQLFSIDQNDESIKFNANLQQIKFENTFIGDLDPNIYQNIVFPSYYNSTQIMNSYDAACSVVSICDAPFGQKYNKFCEQYYVKKNGGDQHLGCMAYANLLNFGRIKSGNPRISDEIIENYVCKHQI